jgi:AAA domain-containing protein
VRRRREAIDRIGSHTYLLRSLSAPGQVYMDTREANLPVALNPDLVDEHKRAVIHDVLRVRPIYALQGPPGTGKTTLVARLLREILEDDPVAQVLVTAQAHAAVDVLREKVRLEAFKDVPETNQPLAVRLGRATSDTFGDDPDAVEAVAARILDGAIQRLSGRDSPHPLQQDWLEVATDLRAALRAGSVRADANDFAELVRRGANLTYCTTSAGELEELAQTTQSYDWSIVEEAGKAHGFDLALPLQAGHRWLLIGDHKQLPPYRFEEYEKAFKNLDVVVKALGELPDGGSGLVDRDWLRAWREYSDEEKKAFQDFAGAWLRTFATVFDQCRFAPPATEAGEERLTLDEPVGAAAGMLSAQHRMHPDIAELISQAYYDGTLVGKTIDAEGRPASGVVHRFDTPAAVRGRAIVWLDTPWAAVSTAYAESRAPRYSNMGEARLLRRFLEVLDRPRDDPSILELAVLTPYLAQLRVLNRELGGLVLPPCNAADRLHRRGASEASGGVAPDWSDSRSQTGWPDPWDPPG